MANSPAARARRKQARKNYPSDSSFDESSSTSSTHSSCENVSLSHRKKRTNRVRACALAARKVSIDNDDNDENPRKKAADPVLTLKLNVETKPGMYIFNTFKAFLGLGNQDQNRTPMLANTPVVPAQDLQALYENQVAVPKGATKGLCTVHISGKDLDCV